MSQSPFIDRSGWTPPPLELWEPVHVSREQIDAEIERLASQPRPANGRRQSLIVRLTLSRATPASAAMSLWRRLWRTTMRSGSPRRSTSTC